jgi:hypothetical protein
MSFARLLVKRALALTAIGGLGCGAWWAFDHWFLIPTQRLQEYNTGRRVWDPLAEVLSEPVKADEGFVCPGGMLYGGNGVGQLQVTRTRKVKVIGKFGDDVLVVKMFNGVSDINGRNRPDLRMYTKDFRKALPCPAGDGQP